MNGFKLKQENAVIGGGQTRFARMMSEVSGIVDLEYRRLGSFPPDQLQGIGGRFEVRARSDVAPSPPRAPSGPPGFGGRPVFGRKQVGR